MFIIIMLIFQITLFVTFVFFILGYSYLLITPGLLIGSTPIINYVKTLAQSFTSLMLSKGFKTNYKLCETQQNIKQLINENPDKIDVIVCNHTSILDFLLVMSYLEEFEIDSYNFVFKNEILYTPGFGFIMYSCPDIKLNRNWEQDKETLGKQLDKIKSNGKKQVIIIFPEGTRLTETKLKEGQDFSKLNNLPVFDNLMVPKSKGLWFILNHLSETGNLGRIWDVTFILPNYIQKSIKTTDIFTKPIGDVNTIWREVSLNSNFSNPDDFKKWLMNLWVTKDSFIKHHNKLVFNQVYPQEKTKTSNKLLIIILLIGILGCFFNKYTRYYLLGSFLLSYILIIFKL